MKIANIPLITIPVDMSSDFELMPIYLGNTVNYSIQLVFTGSPVGTFKLQCSDDPGNPTLPGKQPQSDTVVHWTDITDSIQAITEAGNHAWNVQNVGYLWVKVAYVRTSGTGALEVARMTIKGA